MGVEHARAITGLVWFRLAVRGARDAAARIHSLAKWLLSPLPEMTVSPSDNFEKIALWQPLAKGATQVGCNSTARHGRERTIAESRDATDIVDSDRNALQALVCYSWVPFWNVRLSFGRL
jgi:hypothetical protein